ncbi:hypothetical protein JXI42_00380 [bacterium]|nr:hypothetical protein [bacterium]
MEATTFIIKNIGLFYYTILLKVIYVFKQKPLSGILKGQGLAGSPDWSICRTFICQFHFHIPTKIPSLFKKAYRNPIYLAIEYKQMIESGKAKNQTELARVKGISRARVTQILNLLKLDTNIIDYLKQLGDPMVKRMISEKELRKIIHQIDYPD